MSQLNLPPDDNEDLEIGEVQPDTGKKTKRIVREYKLMKL